MQPTGQNAPGYATFYFLEKGGWSMMLRTRRVEPSRYNRLLRWLIVRLAHRLLRRQQPVGMQVEFDSSRQR